MELTTKKTFSADLKELKKMIEWARGYLLQIDCDPILIRKVELALEEALVNIIRHAYESKGGSIDLCFLGKKKGYLEIEIQDQGPPFNPVKEAAPVNPSLPLEEREVGGLGVHLMKQMVDEVLYRREENRNILTLKKKLS